MERTGDLSDLDEAVDLGDLAVSGTPGGMYRTDVQSAVLTDQRCNPNYAYGYDRYGRYYYDLHDKASTLPDWYNGHNLESKPNDINAREFAVVTDTPRKVTNAVTFTNINRAAPSPSVNT